MDYKKEYEEMARRCKELHEAGNALTKMQMEIVCPELAESREDKIREQIAEIIRNLGKGVIPIPSNQRELLDWLENKSGGALKWRRISMGERLPCDAFLCINGNYLHYMPNAKGVTVGGDGYYLPKTDLEKLPKEEMTPEEKMNHPLYLEGFDVGRRVGKVEAEYELKEKSEIPTNGSSEKPNDHISRD